MEDEKNDLKNQVQLKHNIIKQEKEGKERIKRSATINYKDHA